MSALTRAMDGPWWDTVDTKGNPILKRDKHGPIIASRVSIARRCGLGQGNMSKIWEPLPADTKTWEREWLMTVIRGEPVENLVYSGLASKAYDKFAGFAGALIRNFKDARVLMVDEIAELQLRDGYVEAQALFVPDFLIPGETAAKTEKTRQAVISVLRKRMFAKEPLVVYATETKATPWGGAFHEELDAFLDGGVL